MAWRRRVLAALVAAAVGCGSEAALKELGTSVGEATPELGRVEAPPPPVPAKMTPGKQGGAVALAATGDRLYVADEDHARLRVVPLPLGTKGSREIDLGGRPAAVLALADRVLVTLRDPGTLVILRAEGDSLVEEGRVAVADDAWGVAATPDERLAVVTSAWTATVSAVDLAARKKVWSLPVAREPRGVTVTDGAVFVSHLVGADVTRIDGIDREPRARRVRLPAAPLRTPADRAEAASLGYVALLSPDGSRLFAPRRALAAAGRQQWAGAGTVDVLLTADDTPMLEPVAERVERTAWIPSREQLDHTGQGAYEGAGPFVQPRAAVYRKSTETLLVADEGSDALVELDALAIDPSFRTLQRYRFVQPVVAFAGVTNCGAPTGVALAEDEATAYLYCRSSDSLAAVELAAAPGKLNERQRAAEEFNEPLAKVTSAALLKAAAADDKIAARGRRLFYAALDRNMSDGVACATCHPDGRDDGHVWHDLGGEGSDFARVNVFEQSSGVRASDLGAARFRQGFIGAPIANLIGIHNVRGRPRQTPMLAGRVGFEGPYGWRGLQKNLEARVLEGFEKHRWFFNSDGWGGFVSETPGDGRIVRAQALAAFLRTGLVPPPRHERSLSAREERGKQVFMSDKTACASCHSPDRGFTNLTPVMLGEGQPLATDESFNYAEPQQYRTPSLLYVAGTAPYFHDGRYASLAELVDRNQDHMGWTSHLDTEERAALVSYLETL
jgi:cytochrome c peroxidase